MARNNWVWAEDNKGQALTPGLTGAWPTSWPQTLQAISKDDPYRSLSEWVRDEYGYVKCETTGDTSHFNQCHHTRAPPFLEFKWADLFRNASNLSDTIYTLTPEEQVAPLWSLVPEMIKLAQGERNAGMAGYNQDPKEQIPDSPIAIDSRGCEK